MSENINYDEIEENNAGGVSVTNGVPFCYVPTDELADQNDCFDWAIDELIKVLNRSNEKWPTLYELERKHKRVNELKCTILRQARKAMEVTGIKGSMNSISAYAAARIILETGDVAVTQVEEDGTRVILYYHHTVEGTSDNAGIWTYNKAKECTRIRRIATRLGVDDSKLDKVAQYVRDDAPVIEEDDYKGIVLAKNGVVDLDTHEVTPYVMIDGTENPDYISQYGERHFFRKIDTEFDINAVDPVFTAPDGTEWSVEKHFEQLFGTGSEADIKTTAVWWFYNFAVRGISGGRINIWNDGTNNAAGGGGKSTTIDLIGRVIGERNILYRDLPDLTGRFAKADMVGKMLIVGYDCNADAISDTAFFKKLPFGEAISIEAKFGAVQSYRYKGAIVQAMQGFIKPKNPDGAFYRRLLTIPFFARFTGSKDKEEKNYIQDDYIKREEVRKYVLKKAVIMGNRETYPKNIVNALEQYTKEARSGSSPIYQFLDEFAKSMQNSELPLDAVFAMYVEYCKMTGHKNPANIDTFIREGNSWVIDNPGYRIEHRKSPSHFSKKSVEEPMLGYYKPAVWCDETDHEKWNNEKLGTKHRRWFVRYDILTGNQLETRNTKYSEYELKQMYENNYVGAWYKYYCEMLMDGRVSVNDILSYEEWKSAGGLMPEKILIATASIKEGFRINGFVPILAASSN